MSGVFYFRRHELDESATNITEEKYTHMVNLVYKLYVISDRGGAYGSTDEKVMDEAKTILTFEAERVKDESWG